MNQITLGLPAKNLSAINIDLEIAGFTIRFIVSHSKDSVIPTLYDDHKQTHPKALHPPMGGGGRNLLLFHIHRILL
jgi:hypothetical protein